MEVPAQRQGAMSDAGSSSERQIRHTATKASRSLSRLAEARARISYCEPRADRVSRRVSVHARSWRWFQSGFNSILPHTHRPGHETTRRATSPGATGLLCTDARVRGPCDCVPHPPGLSPLCTDARIANQPKCIPPPLGVGPSSFFISASSHRNLRLAWRRLYADRPSPQPQRRSLRSRRAT